MLWIKALHISFMVTWFAGLFYLPRLFVYHAQCDDAPGHQRFKVMERKLFAMMTMGAVLTIIPGLWMLMDYAWAAYVDTGWLHIKMLLILLLLAYHGYCLKILRDFSNQRNRRSHVFYRWFNELPVLILFAIIILVIVQPF